MNRRSPPVAEQNCNPSHNRFEYIERRGFTRMIDGDEVGKQSLVPLERIMFHLDEVTRFWNQLDLSEIDQLKQREWDTRIKACKDSIEYIKKSIQKLIKVLA